MEMIKLLYITNGIKGAGGLERVLSIKAGYLAEVLGYEVHILVLNHNGATPFYDFSPKIKLHDIAVGGNPLQYIRSYSRGIKSLVDKIRPDVISVCDDGLKGFFLPMILRKPCAMIYERHVSKIVELGPDPGIGKRLAVNAKFFLMNKLGASFDKFVVLTSDNTSEWHLKNIMVIPNPLSFYPAESSALENKIVMAVGKQAYQKGYDRLLHIWKEVSDRNPGWKLHIYGKKDPAQKLPELAAQLGIAESVAFFDPERKIEQKFLSSSIFAFASRFEGFGMVLTEAMACGVPCVSFDCPCGPRDIVRHNEDGYLVPNGDLHEFAEHLEKLIRNDELRLSFGRKAKENSKRFLPESIMPHWDSLFNSLAR